MKTNDAKWLQIQKAKQAQRDALIPQAWRIPPTDAVSVMDVPATCGVLSPRELDLTEHGAVELVAMMTSGKATSAEVVLAFCKRAAVAQQLTNCLTEIMFEEALQTAKAIDKDFAATGRVRGPLHGLPISLKDNFHVKGVDTTVGFVAWANDPATEEQESEMTKLLRAAGAIIFCKTNVPTAMMMAETYNNVWGYTLNPLNRRLTAGGSSGGEAALLVLKGSPLGVGTDIGGSLRIPAACCGIFTLKPSFGRFPTYGARSGMPGQEAIRSINGPMSTDLASCKLWSQAVVASKPWLRDPSTIPLPWREYEAPKQLCFGIVFEDGIVKPTPPVTRALMETKAALEKAGHKVFTYELRDVDTSNELRDAFFLGDGGIKIAEVIEQSGEDWPAGMGPYRARYEALKTGQAPLVGALWTTQSKRTAFVKKQLDQWQATADITGTGRPMDGLICPTHAYSSAPMHTFRYLPYTSTWNLCDLPVAVFPAATVDTTLDAKPDYTPRNDDERAIWERYDVQEVAGARVGLQMMVPRLEEETALALAGIAVEALNSASS